MEEKILQYILEQYDPQAILLVGSRYRGDYMPDSDWDFLVLGPSPNVGSRLVDWGGEVLDISVRAVPASDQILSTGFYPLVESTVLFEKIEGLLDQVMQNTQQAYEQGPLGYEPQAVQRRWRGLHHRLHKITKYQDQPMVQDYYAGAFYELAWRLWFELQNRWSQKPSISGEEIRTEGPDFADVLNNFFTASGEQRTLVASAIVEVLQKFKK